MVRSSDGNKTQTTLASLRRANGWLALVYALQGAAILVLGKRAEVNVTTSYLTPDAVQSTLAGHTVLAPATHTLWAVNIGYVVAASLFIAAAVYGSVVTWCQGHYEADMAKRVNRARWVDFGVSLGVMLAAVAMLGGVYDFASLVMLFALTAAQAMFALLGEYMRQGKRLPPGLAFGLSGVAGLVALLLVGMYLWGAAVWGGGHVAAHVVWTYATLVAGFVAIGGNMWLFVRAKGKWAEYAFAERVYMVLGVMLKSALAWEIYAGVLRG